MPTNSLLVKVIPNFKIYFQIFCIHTLKKKKNWTFHFKGNKKIYGACSHVVLYLKDLSRSHLLGLTYFMVNEFFLILWKLSCPSTRFLTTNLIHRSFLSSPKCPQMMGEWNLLNTILNWAQLPMNNSSVKFFSSCFCYSLICIHT